MMVPTETDRVGGACKRRPTIRAKHGETAPKGGPAPMQHSKPQNSRPEQPLGTNSCAWPAKPSRLPVPDRAQVKREAHCRLPIAQPSGSGDLCAYRLPLAHPGGRAVRRFAVDVAAVLPPLLARDTV
mmetsp:Transcript_25085/g.68949  ORF Transcript_25085/g.68949 Transcript_25085/m.68949 type:complete len:127 (-) Transcript_25085:61-441(-)